MVGLGVLVSEKGQAKGRYQSERQSGRRNRAYGKAVAKIQADGWILSEVECQDDEVMYCSECPGELLLAVKSTCCLDMQSLP